ncbi:penicillin-binding transpeptidase domain-containing protein [uncultured Phycicoccus sp.]|uniref:penicillin-binding transpeptidase domain-containing protein n=1 Tax=uncultured Phycicoccus sp. TaxID=661422 RepID=UPI0026263BBA|nr:penicillin-binding transpeptidase domain-containing protein [uncultured Phycicoccus sp.]
MNFLRRDGPAREQGLSRVAALLVAALVLTAIGGGIWWWQGRQQAAVRAASAYAASAAAALERGELPPGVDVEDRAAAQEALDRVLGGMGDLEHRVEVSEVVLEDGESSGRVVLTHAWRIQQDKDPWTYETTLPVERRGEDWQGLWSTPVVADGLETGERIRAVRLDPERADVLGDGDAPLVAMREVGRIGIDRSEVPDAAEAVRSAEQLAALVDIDADAYAARVEGAGAQAFVEAITYRVQAPELLVVEDEMTDIPGARVVGAELPLAPTSSFARPILGASGQATAEIIEKSEGRVRAGDLVGLSGLQATYDESLAGTPGYAIEAVDLDTEEVRRLREVAATDGTPLRTTLGEAHQSAAEAALEDVEPASAVVAIRPSDGHVLAAASGPGSKGYSTATLGQYAPGSTFKSVSALALLRAGLTERSVVDCPPTTVVDGRTFKNFDDYPPERLGRISLRTVVANSCNTGLMEQRGRLEAASLPDAAAALGLTAEPRLGVPAALGSVPAPGSDVETAASMIGQGKVLATPLGMATVAASLQRGAPVAPLLVRPDGPDGPPAAAPSPSLTEAEHTQMLDMLRAVVTEGGARFLADVPGEPVLAKTGTAEFGEASDDGSLETHAWMIGIQGDLAVAVFVERGSGGSSVAGPVLRDFLVRVADTT